MRHRSNIEALCTSPGAQQVFAAATVRRASVIRHRASSRAPLRRRDTFAVYSEVSGPWSQTRRHYGLSGMSLDSITLVEATSGSVSPSEHVDIEPAVPLCARDDVAGPLTVQSVFVEALEDPTSPIPSRDELEVSGLCCLVLQEYPRDLII